MRIVEKYTPQINLIKRISWLSLLTIPPAIVIGGIIALFIRIISRVSLYRFSNPLVIYILPVAGLISFFVCKAFKEKSSNIVLQNIHEIKAGVSEKSIAPIFLTAILSHIFGASVGREGSSLQIGAGISRLFDKLYRLKDLYPKELYSTIIIISGIAAAFGAIFGTPVAAALFALERIKTERFPYNTFFPCLIASITGSITCNYWGMQPSQFPAIFSSHANRSLTNNFHLDLLLLAKIVLLGVITGLLSCLFLFCTKYVRAFAQRWISIPYLIPFVGGMILVSLVVLTSQYDYLGLGIISPNAHSSTIASAFTTNGVCNWSWLWKFIFTVIMVGFGFRGGEIVPLLFIGATLASVLSFYLHTPVELFVCLGFISIFAAASNTPFACMFLGIELYGGPYIPYYLIVCFVAYTFSPSGLDIESEKWISIPKIFDPEYFLYEVKQYLRKNEKHHSR